MSQGEKWARLSRTLRFPRHPEICQSCGENSALGGDLERWIEHDDNDQKENIVVVLCPACSEKLIQKHPRLYESIHNNAPLPGSMMLCIDCAFRRDLNCSHPALTANGGSGLLIHFSKPQTAHIQACTKSGQRRGFWYTTYAKPPSECAGRQVNEKENDGESQHSHDGSERGSEGVS